MKQNTVSVFVMAMLLFGISSCLAAPGAVGGKMQDVTVSRLSGEKESLLGLVKANGTGRLTLVVIWATWCTYCGEELRDLATHKDELDKLGIDILAVSIDGSLSTVSQYLQRSNISLPVVVNPRGDVMEKLLLRLTPGNFLVTADSYIILRGPGYQDYNHLSTYLREAKRRAEALAIKN